MTIAAFPLGLGARGRKKRCMAAYAPQPPTRRAIYNPAAPTDIPESKSVIDIDPQAPRRRAALSARAGTNTTARHPHITAGREFQRAAPLRGPLAVAMPRPPLSTARSQPRGQLRQVEKKRHYRHLRLIGPIACGNNLRVSASYILLFSRDRPRRWPSLVSQWQQKICNHPHIIFELLSKKIFIGPPIITRK
jgi:hypothetical protein